MTKYRWLIIAILCFTSFSLVLPAHAQASIQLASDTLSLTFPESALFSAEFKSGVNITSAVLEYGVDQLTCGTVVAMAFPQFAPATDVKVSWTWEMRQSGSLPPGATIWWHWVVKDANGVQFTSPRQTAIWLDSVHSWQVISGGNINLHYYDGGQPFGQSLHDTAAQALVRLTQDVGIGTDNPVDIYIYANTNDLKDAVLYEPSWVGGQAFPEKNIVIIGVSTDQLDWGKSTEAHELTHVIVGHLTFTCLGSIPTWLDEGLAVYGEGGSTASEVALFDQARAANQLLSLRSLAGAFSEDANRANLSYGESYSVVNFLLHSFGRTKMTALLISLKNGATVDESLFSVYGFDTDGLEDAWRTSIGAAPRSGLANPTPIATPTQVPTFVPVGAVPQAVVPTLLPTQVQPTATLAPGTLIPVPAATTVPLIQIPGTSSDALTWIVVGLGGCILVIMVVAVVVLVTTSRRSRRQK